MSKEAMQLALEALENAGEAVYARGGIAAVGSLNIAAQALRQALETEQEPVAWLDPEENISDEAFTWSQSKHHTVPLYTAPPKREWVGLTEPELHEINPTWPAPGQHWDYEDVLAFVRAIEAKLKEKNGG